MPIYEYHCEDCDSSFETFVQPGHYDEAYCPSCTSVKISREMSVFASGAGQGAPKGSGPAMMRGGGGCCGGACGCH